MSVTSKDRSGRRRTTDWMSLCERIYDRSSVVGMIRLLCWVTVLYHGRTIVDTSMYSSTPFFEEEGMMNVLPVLSSVNKTSDPIKKIMELSGSLHMTFEEGQAYCNRTFPMSNISLFYVEDRIVAPSDQSQQETTTIPKMIHMTSQTRCLSKPLFDNANSWKEALPDYSFFLHDGQARERFFEEANDDYDNHMGIPYMTMLRPCLKESGATVSDIWRYMFLFQYGGLYVDFDDGPGDKIQTVLSRFPQAQAILVQFEGNKIAQNFFMVMPRHPLLHFAMLETLLRLLLVTDVGGQYIPFTTGPQALAIAYHKFMGVYDVDGSTKTPTRKPYWRKGHYVGYDDWSVDVVASWNEKRHFVETFVVLDPVKKEYYDAVNAIDYERDRFAVHKLSDGKSCFARIADTLASNNRR